MDEVQSSLKRAWVRPVFRDIPLSTGLSLLLAAGQAASVSPPPRKVASSR